MVFRSFELLMWVNRFPEEYTSVTKHEGLFEEVYNFCLDNDFHENPFFMDYDTWMAIISEANISHEHNLMQEHEEKYHQARRRTFGK